MTTNQAVRLGVLGPLEVQKGGEPVEIAGVEPRAILTMLGLCSGSVVAADVLVALLWGEDPPPTADEALRNHISALCHTLGDGVVLAEGQGWFLAGSDVDAARFRLLVAMGRDASAAGELGDAVACFEEACTLWRGSPGLPDSPRGLLETTRWSARHAALVDDRDFALQGVEGADDE